MVNYQTTACTKHKPLGGRFVMIVDTIITFIIGGNIAEQIHIVPIATIVGAGAVVSIITSVNTSLITSQCIRIKAMSSKGNTSFT
jgi:hypothetical protein